MKTFHLFATVYDNLVHLLRKHQHKMAMIAAHPALNFRIENFTHPFIAECKLIGVTILSSCSAKSAFNHCIGRDYGEGKLLNSSWHQTLGKAFAKGWLGKK